MSKPMNRRVPLQEWLRPTVLMLLLFFSVSGFAQNTIASGKWLTDQATVWSTGVAPATTAGTCASGAAADGSTCAGPVSVNHALTLDQALSVTTGVFYINQNVTDNGTNNISVSNNGSYSASAGILDIKAGTTTVAGTLTVSNG